MAPPKKRKKYWHQVHNLKQVSGFVSEADRDFLRSLAEKEDRKLTRYITRLLERHIAEHKHPK